MTPAIAEALMFAGIAPPAYGSRKTTCPQCSPRRAKSAERCLSIYPGSRLVAWRCHHCGWEGEEVAQ